MIPVLDARASDDELAAACRRVGAFQWRLTPERAAVLGAAMAHAARFFARPIEDKRALDIARSSHHRGWSEMQGERDFREQLHLGSEEPAPLLSPKSPPWLRLVGENPWPTGDGALRSALLDHLASTAALGCRLAAALGVPAALAEGTPYLVMKLIHYHPQPGAVPARAGVAAHVDFSLVTLLAQDDAGGLEVRLGDGRWCPVDPLPDALVVNLGEIAEAVGGGALRATPHRVVNPSRSRPRLSIPVFVNPPLGARVEPRPAPARADRSVAEHVHRVLPEGTLAPFVYGAAEWRRKGENLWCHACCRREQGPPVAP